MRALRRIRALAAVSALLLFLAGSALADVPDRPIDSPGNPGPLEVGDPDAGHDLVVIVLGHHVYFIRVKWVSSLFAMLWSEPAPVRRSTKLSRW